MWVLQSLQRIKSLSLTIFLCFISPLFLVFILLLSLYRGLICLWAKVTRKDLSGMIGPSTSIYASDELYGIPNRNIVCTLVLKGKLSLESIQDKIERKIVDLKDAQGKYKYPRLRMFPSRFQGYLFWKEEEEFRIGTHVVMYEKARDNNRIWTEQNLQEIQRNIIRKQWTRFASPWEILLLPNYKTQNCGMRDVNTVLCVRFHMCIGNEVPWMNILTQMLCEDGQIAEEIMEQKPEVSISPPKTEFIPFSSKFVPSVIANVLGKVDSDSNSNAFSQRIRSLARRILKKLAIPFRMPHDLAEQILEMLTSSSSEEGNEWDVKEKILLKRDHVVTLDRFSVQHVREIKNMLGVTFSSVLIAALASALRVTFIEAGYKLPSHMKIMLPTRGRGDSQEIQKSFSWINLPLMMSSSNERLRCCESAQENIHRSTKLVINRFLMTMVGLLPFKYHWYFLRRRPWVGVMMNVKGPKDVVTLCDHQVEDVIITSASDSGFVVSFASYADYLRISLVIDYRLVPTETMAKNLLKNIYAELVLLGIDGAAAV